MIEAIFGPVTPENSEIIGSYIEAFATAGSAIVALIVGWIAYRGSLNEKKEKHTVDIMLQLVRNRHLSHAALMLDEYANEHTHLEKWANKKPETFSLDDLEPEEFYDLFMLLGFYEFIAQGCHSKMIDVDVVRKQRKSRIINTWLMVGPTIQQRRIDMDKKGLYEELEKLAWEFATKKQRAHFPPRIK